METVRFGIVGFGTQGSVYSGLLSGRAIPGLPNVTPRHASLGAICVRSREKAQLVRDQFPGVPVFESYGDMLGSGCCDAVIPTVPHYLHHTFAMEAIEAGIHVLSEKPLGVRASDVQQLLDCAARQPHVSLGVFFNQRTNPLYQRVKALLSSGELGSIRRSNWIINSWWRPDSYYAQNPWRGTWGGEGGGVLVNQAPHQLDLWQWLCGMPREVTAVNRLGAYRNIGVENDVTMVTRYADGSTGCFITCTHDPIGTDRLEIDLDGGKLLVEDSRRLTVCRLNHSEQELNQAMTMMDLARLTQANGSGSGLYTTEHFEHSDPWGVQHSAVMENFARHILYQEPLLAPAEEGMKGVRLANACQLSGWTGKTVCLPCDQEEFNTQLNLRIRAEGKFPERSEIR